MVSARPRIAEKRFDAALLVYAGRQRDPIELVSRTCGHPLPTAVGATSGDKVGVVGNQAVELHQPERDDVALGREGFA